MKPLTVFLALGLTFQQGAILAQEGTSVSGMEIKYAMARIGPGHSTEAIAGLPYSRPSPRTRNLFAAFSFPAFDPDAPASITSSLSIGVPDDDDPEMCETLVRCEPLTGRFSWLKLTEGSIYDFRSRKNHRLELGGNWDLIDTKYEEPLSMMIFIRRPL